MAAAQNTSGSDPDSIPCVRVKSLRVAVRDGWYNAFTDLTYWKDYYWLTFGRGTAHHGERNLDL